MTVQFAALFLLFAGTSFYKSFKGTNTVPISTVIVAQAGIVLVLGIIGSFLPALAMALMALASLTNVMGVTPIVAKG
jgi:hypothetical protein